MDDYGTQTYWEDLYAGRYKDKTFDWYQDFSVLLPHLEARIKSDSSILMMGCGNSTMSSKLYGLGFHNINNIDYSPSVITFMREKSKDMPEMTWEVMDATNMTFAADTYDIVLDKGTLDSIMCRLDSKEFALLMAQQAHRILKPGGMFIIISFDGNRTAALGEGWQSDVTKLEYYDNYHQRTDAHWMYFLTKL